MTLELLEQANKLNHAIHDLDVQIRIVEDMHHCDNNLVLEVDSVGAITIADDEELKDDIIDMVLSRLNNKKSDLEDQLRLL